MKVIIIEGPDNCGKSTLLNQLIDEFEVMKLVHCIPPIGNTNEEKFEYQKNIFNYYIDMIADDAENDSTEAIIFNRFYQGEYVYGQIYRNSSKRSVSDLLEDFDNKLLNISNVDIYYIQMTCDCPDLLIEHEDGTSFSNSDASKISQEMSLFFDAFNMSKLNKATIKVNEGMNFRDKEEILKEVNKFIEMA